jgi:hypothetical protein
MKGSTRQTSLDRREEWHKQVAKQMTFKGQKRKAPNQPPTRKKEGRVIAQTHTQPIKAQTGRQTDPHTHEGGDLTPVNDANGVRSSGGEQDSTHGNAGRKLRRGHTTEVAKEGQIRHLKNLTHASPQKPKNRKTHQNKTKKTKRGGKKQAGNGRANPGLPCCME